MAKKIPLGDGVAIFAKTPLSHAQPVEKRPINTRKRMKQNLLLPHIRSGLGSHRLRPAISVRLHSSYPWPKDIATVPGCKLGTGHNPSLALHLEDARPLSERRVNVCRTILSPPGHVRSPGPRRVPSATNNSSSCGPFGFYRFPSSSS